MTDRPSASAPATAAASASELLSPPSAPNIDPLSDVLRSVRLSGALFFLHQLSSPCPPACVPQGTLLAPALAPSAQNVISYHVITAGSLWAGLYDGSGETIRLDPGDVLVVPRGDAYFLGLDNAVPPPPRAEQAIGFLRGIASGALPFVLSNGGGGAQRAGVVCGFLGCDQRPFNPLVESLPRLLIVRGVRPPAGPPRDRLDRLIDLTLAESQENQPGAESVRLRLSELIFVETIRRHLTTMQHDQTGWLAGLRDDVVGRALSLLHDKPARAWTLPELAKETGASRSALADRFARLVGQPPMAYLAQWRMQLAARLLAAGETKVAAVALEVGYDSEAAFSRAFKKAAGVAPAAWRDRLRMGAGGDGATAAPLASDA